MPHFDYSICYGHSNILLSRLARRASKQSIIFIHADLANRTSKQLKRLSRGMKFSKFIDVICVSNKAKTSYIRLIENREVQVINNYINAEEILASANEVNNFNVDGNCKNFVTVCRIEEKSKKISRIITATSILLTEGYNFKYAITQFCCVTLLISSKFPSGTVQT